MSPRRAGKPFNINDLADKEHVKTIYEKFAVSKKKQIPRIVDLFHILLDLYVRDIHLKTGITEKLVTSELKKKIKSDPLFWKKEKRPTMESAKSYINRFKRHLRGFDLVFESVPLQEINNTVKDKTKNSYVFRKPYISTETTEMESAWQQIKESCSLYSKTLIRQLKDKYDPALYVHRKK